MNYKRINEAVERTMLTLIWGGGVVLVVALLASTCFAGDKARAAVAVSISRVHVAQSRPVIPNDFADRVSRNSSEQADYEARIQSLKLQTDQLAEEAAQQANAVADREQRIKDLDATNKDLESRVIKLVDEATKKNCVQATPPRAFGAMGLSLVSQSTGEPPQFEVMAYTGEDYHGKRWCGNCPAIKEKIGTGNKNVRVIWSGELAPGEQIYPAFRFPDREGKIRFPADERGQYRVPSSLKELEDLVMRHSEARTVAAASGPGGSIRTGGRIRAMLDAYAAYLGPDAKTSLKIERNGLQSLSVTKLMHGEPWPAKQVVGTFGRVTLSTTSTRLPGGLQTIGFTYRVLDDGRWSIAPDSIIVALPNVTNEEQRGATEAGPCGFDPLTVGLTIAQVASALYQMLNPQIDVGLGGAITLTAQLDGPNKLVMEFSDCPSIHVAAWFHFDLEVQRLEIGTDRAKVSFKPQPRNWIRIDSREFSVDDSIGFGEAAGFGAAPRSGKWHTVRNHFIAEHPNCCICGREATQVHHVKPFHLDPSLELEPSNLRSLCDDCHFCIAHLWNYGNENPDLDRHAEILREAKRGADEKRKTTVAP